MASPARRRVDSSPYASIKRPGETRWVVRDMGVLGPRELKLRLARDYLFSTNANIPWSKLPSGSAIPGFHQKKRAATPRNFHPDAVCLEMETMSWLFESEAKYGR